jgi:zinc protease
MHKRTIVTAFCLLTATARAQSSVPPPVMLENPPKKFSPLLMPGMDIGPARKPAPPVGPNPANGEQPGRIRSARATPVLRETLDNGMRVLVTEAPQENIVATELLIQAGSMEEKSPVSGITSMICELLTERINDLPNDESLDESTGSIIKLSAEPDYARISVESTSENFPNILAAIGKALQKPTISKAEMEKVRKKVLDNYSDGEGAMNQLDEMFRQTFYRFHPYRTLPKGSKLVIERLTAKELQDYMAQYFVPNRIVLSVSGRVDRIAVRDLAKTDFGAMQPNEIKEIDIAWEPQPQEKEIFLSGGTTVAWLVVGFPAPSIASKDYPAMRLIEAVMGEGLSSRLFTEIREKRSLAYELGAQYPPLRGPSHLLTYAITKPEQMGAARKQLLLEFERLKKEGVPAQELNENRNKVIGNYLLERETNSGKAFSLALAEISGVGFEFDQNFIKEIKAVTPSEVQDVAKRYLENYTMIVARPAGHFYWDL